MSDSNSKHIIPDETWDDYPNCEPVKMGSTVEADMLAEWSRWELVDLIQSQDKKLQRTEEALRVARDSLKYIDAENQSCTEYHTTDDALNNCGLKARESLKQIDKILGETNG